MMAAIVVAVFITVAIGVFVMMALLSERSARARLLRERLTAIESAARRGPNEEVELLRDETMSEIPALHRFLARSTRAVRLQRFLAQADLRIRAGKFLLLSTCLLALMGLVGQMLTGSALFALLFAVFGGAAPWIYASVLRTRRFHRFEAIFPEAIDLLGRAVRAGHAFSTALELIAEELAEPVSGEFRKLFEEQKFGLPLREALLNLAERVPIIDVKFFVTAVMLQRESGGNLAEILDKLSYVIRERFKIVRQVRVYTAQGRLTLMLLMALPPGLVMVMLLLNPDFIKPLFTDPIGHVLVFLGVVTQTIGFFLIRRIIHIQV